MNPQEINKRIAIACGWEIHPKDRFVVIPPNSPNSVQPLNTIPNYHGDLNAMHEAEKWMTGNMRLLDFWKYADTLKRITPANLGCDSYIHATAAQRAEAFLRTIGQWEDEK